MEVQPFMATEKYIKDSRGEKLDDALAHARRSHIADPGRSVQLLLSFAGFWDAGDHGASHALGRPASDKRQGTKFPHRSASITTPVWPCAAVSTSGDASGVD
jgi:hypothetical protein